jgi:uncharacterized protein (TIGR00288 family)
VNSFPPHRGSRTVSVPTPQAPNAALLIDFDNVTLGVRSDLTKELRHLLDSDIIKGKVSVQRAYADWRRYPQYIVPLSESSIDLIFAPAFGTNKKNATDIRLAIDATELVFTRPEIGTFILLSGDSDFSSLVIKLKEYGKYVIGVGIRESASDILIQNCDEYYSYTDLAGLTRESDVPSTQRDPWELVVEAVQQMVANRDVMRADRLKQVMQQIDSNFDEKNAGFNRFSKFVQEAGNRGLITLSKMENGQYEVGPASRPSSTAAKSPDTAPKEESPRGRRGRRGRGGASAAAPAATSAAPAAPAAPAPTASEASDGDRDRRRRRRGGRGRGRGDERESTESSAPPRREHDELTLAEAFHLLTRALGELPAPVPHDTLRARMAAIHGREDPLLDAETFTRLLRQANDAEVADVRQVSEGQFEVSPHKTDLALQMRPTVETAASNGTATSQPSRPTAALRFRSGSLTTRRNAPIPMVGVVKLDDSSDSVAPDNATSAEQQSPEAGKTATDAGKSKPRRGKRGGKSTKAARTAGTAKSTAAAEVAKSPEAREVGQDAVDTRTTRPTRRSSKSTRSAAAVKSAEGKKTSKSAKPAKSAKSAKRSTRKTAATGTDAG